MGPNDNNAMMRTIITDWQNVRPPLLNKYAREASLRSMSRVFGPKPLPIGRDTYNFASASWRILLGTVAFLDFVATVIVGKLQPTVAICPVGKRHFFSFQSHSCDVVEEEDSSSSAIHQLSSYLLYFCEQWATPISILFALLWFVDSFLKAQWKRNEKVLKLDKRRLLRGDRESRVEGAWGTYYTTIAIQLLFLPVGFFVFVGQLYAYLRNNDQLDGNTSEHGEEESSFYTVYSTHCLLTALVQFGIQFVSNEIGEELVFYRKKVTWRVFRSAIRRPVKAYSQLRIILRALRLFKYVAPLMGLTIKAVGNITDLNTSIRQHWTVHAGCRRRKQQWRNTHGEEKRILASTRIQSAFRGMQTRKGVRSFMSTLQARKSMIAARMQKAARRSIVRGRSQMDLKKLELRQLKQEARMFRQSGINMGADNRRRMYELEEEIQEAARALLNKRLLVRPNARFAVIWKTIFVVCVVLDVTQQAVQLKMMDQLTKNNEAPNVGDLFERIIPIPATEWGECNPASEKEHSPFARLFYNRKTDKAPPQPPWYCSESIVSMQNAIVSLLKLFSTQLVLLVAVVCYIDVIVTFFIGELHPETGLLVPKSFFKRWIFPGLLLELLANPLMENTTLFLGLIKDDILHIGPLRVWRWTVAGFYPASTLVAKQIEVRFCRPAIAQQNKKAIEHKYADDMSSRSSRLTLISRRNMLISQSNILGNARRRSIYYDRA